MSNLAMENLESTMEAVKRLLRDFYYYMETKELSPEITPTHLITFRRRQSESLFYAYCVNAEGKAINSTDFRIWEGTPATKMFGETVEPNTVVDGDSRVFPMEYNHCWESEEWMDVVVVKLNDNFIQ